MLHKQVDLCSKIPSRVWGIGQKIRRLRFLQHSTYGGNIRTISTYAAHTLAMITAKVTPVFTGRDYSRSLESECLGVRVLAGVRVPFRETPCLFHLDKNHFVAVYLTFAQVNLWLKIFAYTLLHTIVHLLLAEFRLFAKVILKYTSIKSCILSRSPKFFNPWVRVRVK